ncbi:MULTISPECIES: hypothetical protein [Vibrio harveyi group]|uniref:hypothetical protein n=1 Tax=Vibrio harveyi group TaxID=717610 RepID=UPI001EDA5459|nr:MULTISPECIES: hypothetical protein [Vibrio harveyi group]
MKVYGQKTIEVVVDRHCDICGVSVMVDSNGVQLEEVGELTANWGLGQKWTALLTTLICVKVVFKLRYLL